MHFTLNKKRLGISEMTNQYYFFLKDENSEEATFFFKQNYIINNLWIQIFLIFSIAVRSNYKIKKCIYFDKDTYEIFLYFT